MKIICIYHSVDLDGWMSAAIVKKWFLDFKPGGMVYRSPYLDGTIVIGKSKEDSLSMLGWQYGDGIPNLINYDQVIMCDISFPKDEMYKLWNRLGHKFTWCDHHISAMNDNWDIDSSLEGLRDTKFSACELTWKWFYPMEKMPEIVRLLGRYDCFGHKGTEEEQKVLEFQYGARQIIWNYETAFQHLLDTIKYEQALLSIHLGGASIYNYLITEAKSIYKRAFPVMFKLCKGKIDTKGSIATITKYKFLCVNQERFNPINFGIDYHKDRYDGFACFWYKDGNWNFSLYNDNGEVDCSLIAKQYGGGGHKGASGFIISNINKIIKKDNDYIKMLFEAQDSNSIHDINYEEEVLKFKDFPEATEQEVVWLNFLRITNPLASEDEYDRLTNKYSTK